MKNCVIIIPFLLIASLAFAQNAASDFKKMNKFYLDNTNIAMDIEYKFYPNHKSSKAIDVQLANYKKTAGKFYYHLNGITTIQNSKYKVAVHEANEVIMVSKKEAEIDPNIFTGATMDSVLTFCKKIDFQKTSSGNKKYTLHYKTSNYFPYSKVIIELNGNNSLSKMTYYYNHPINYTPEEDDLEEAPKLEIVYKNTSTQPISASQYSLEKFVKIQGQKISPTSKYNGYRIINQII